MSTEQDHVEAVLGAFEAPEPDPALRDVAQSFLIDGRSRRDVINIFEAARRRLSDEQDYEDELLLDYIAVLAGWASSTAVRNLMPPPCKMPARESVPS